jgi:hypothetical protein
VAACSEKFPNSKFKLFPIIRNFEKSDLRNLKTRDRILFVGTLTHTPNRNALDFILKEIAPRIEELYPDLVFSIVGKGTQECKFYSSNVELLGMLENLEDIYSQSIVSLAPMSIAAGINGKVVDLGLSYLYKLPYKFSVVETIERFQNIEDKFQDLTSCIFGYSIKSNEKLENLKGRVYVGHAFAEKDTAKPSDIHKKYILSAPKASYFPNYIEQYPDHNGRIPSNYHTFMHDSAVIRGYKRYPVRNDIAVYNYEDKMDKVATLFTPIEPEAVFSCNIGYHNLRAEELGALISAITFHNSKDH